MSKGEWIAANDQYPPMLGRGDNSEVVLIAKTMKSRPAKLTVSMGWLQREHVNSDRFIWVEVFSKGYDIFPPNVKFWMPLPEPPKDDR